MRAALVAAAALLAWAVPSAAQDPEADYRGAVEARLRGDPAAAVDRLTRLIEAQPGNADLHLQLGLAWLALDRLDEAEAAFHRTLELAPDYGDAQVGLARIAQRRGDRRSALSILGRLPSDHAEGQALRRQLEAPEVIAPEAWRLDIESSYSFLEGDRPDWQELAISLRGPLSTATALGVALQGARRFDRTDVYAEATLDHRVADGVRLYLLAGATPDADFRPEWQLGLGGSWQLGGGSGTVPRLDTRLARYASGDIVTVTPGLEQYLFGGRAWITAQWINLFEDGRHRSGWLARGDVLVDSRLRLFAGAADAPDISEGFVVETLSLFGGAAWDVSESHRVTLSAAHEDRQGGSDRLTFSIGLGLRF